MNIIVSMVLAFLLPTGLLIILFPNDLHAQRVSDFKAAYSLMTIKQATLEKVGTLEVDFYRHNLEMEVGLGQSFVGLTYQYATKKHHTNKIGNTFGNTEDGLMLTAGYNHIFSKHFRLDGNGRIRIWGDTKPQQALYATETDCRLKLVVFDEDGVAMLAGAPVFPSGYLGTNVNRYGRVQGLLGAGIWWKGLGLHLAGYNAFNGVNEVLKPGTNADNIFANLKNRGASLAVTYEFYDFLLWVRQNHAFHNGGHDRTFSLQYQHFFQKQRMNDGKM
ncbi:hypothetical protein HUU05_04465 [candidate division KSB1 bacterium]|nr:hypothetical protein [candidate division KSB1 bacterium]